MKTIQELIQQYADEHLLSYPSKNYEVFKELLEANFDPEIHFTLSYLYATYGCTDSAEQLLEKAVNKEDSRYIVLKDYINALNFCEEHGNLFPLSIPYHTWTEGPHLSMPSKIDDMVLVDWFPAVEMTHEGEWVSFIVGTKEENKWEIFPMKFKKEKLVYDSWEELEAATFFEAGLYESPADAEKVALFVACHKQELWDAPPEIKHWYEMIAPVRNSFSRVIKDWQESELPHPRKNLRTDDGCF